MNAASFRAFMDELGKLAGWHEEAAASHEKHRKGFAEALNALLKRKMSKMEKVVHGRMGTGARNKWEGLPILPGGRK